ncbi:MAG: class I SAM-dependent methyltransferase [Pseudomonadota bacterium]
MKDPEPAVDAATIYDAFADKYRAYSETKSAYIRAIDNLILEQLKAPPNVMLDYGAGDGVRGMELAKQVAPLRFFQADISEKMVARCKELGHAEQVFSVGDVDWSKSLPEVDALVCLWNVLGHVPGTDERRKLLSELFSLIKPSGKLFIDVNNRHYFGYSRWTSLGRRIIDAIKPNYTRGDIRFDWNIDGVDYPASGHFFTPAEMTDLLTGAGFKIEKTKTVHYTTGVVSKELVKGQLFYVASKPE